MTICKRCGTESPDGFQFCGTCGEPLAPPAQMRRTRKVVTALFCDVADSTTLGEELDPEVLREVINRYFADLRATIERHGGTVEKFIGDAVMAVFGIPRVREDDALRAVRAAAEIRERLPVLAEEIGVALHLRTGINTGLVVMAEGENLAVGDAVNIAARLEQTATPGEIVVGHETLLLVRDAVEVEPLEPLSVKGKSEPLRAYRLLGVDPVAPGLARHLDAPLVGRESELRVLREALERAVRERRCHLFTVLGPAGIGKSRLVGELLADVADFTTVLQGRCLHYGEGITFWPLVEALAPLGQVAASVLSRLSQGRAAVPNEMFWEVRRLLESLARQRPVILHVDDLQWAEPMLLDLLDHVADLSRGVPILLACTARPELLESRATWGGGKLNATTILLEPLDAADSGRLLDRLGERLDPSARARLIATSEGNPLFLEEMVALARDQGSVVVPPTIQVLLSARLEGLAVEERELLECAAIEGEVFHRRAVLALSGEQRATEVEPRFTGLVRKELIRPHPPTFQGDDAFRFRHLLIRDAAYEGLPKAVRADLHERFAEWLEGMPADVAELDEIAGWHLEQAVRYHRELGREPDRAVAARATRHLRTAGRRAADRLDSSAAVNLLRRAHAVAPPGDPLVAQTAVDLAEQMVESGELAAADELLTGAEHEPAVATRAKLVRLQWMDLARPDEAAEASLAALPGLLDELARAGDERGLAKAHTAMFSVHWIAGRATAAAEQARLVVVHARAVGDHGMRSRALGQYISTLIFGRHPASEMARELDAIELEEPSIYLTAAIRRGRGWVCRLEGRFDDARRMWQRSVEAVEAMGWRARAAGSMEGLAEIEMAANNPGAALAILRRADASLEELGDRSFRSTTQSYLAEVCEQLGDHPAARAAIALAEELSAPDDAVNFALTHGVRARLALGDADHDAAQRWARSALEFTLRMDFPLDEARARMNLAHVMQALGRRDVAQAETRAALQLYELKEDRPGAAAARARLEQVLDGRPRGTP